MISIPNFKKRHSTNGSSNSSNDRLSAASQPAYDAAALEALVERAERAAEALRSVDSTIERGSEIATLEERINSVGSQLAATEQIAAQFATVRDQAATLAESQELANANLAATEAEVARVSASLAGLVEKVETALELGEDFERITELSTEFSAMRGEAGTIRTQIRDLFDNVIRLRTVHDDVLRAHKHATIRLEGVDQRQQAAATKMDALESRAASADQALAGLLRLAAGIPDVQHQLAVLKSIADQVAQRTAALEQQRDTVERAIAQSSQVVSLGSQFDAALQRQEEQTRALSSLESKLADVQALHATVLARSSEISVQQRELDEAERDAKRELTSLREEMRASAERFELENRSLDAASERIAELRGFVNDCEKRFGAVDASARLVSETDGRARSLASQVAHISEDVMRITTQAERLRVVRDDVGELDESLRELAERMNRVEEVKPLIEQVSSELTALNGAQESIRDGLEQARIASTEMARLRDRQAETNAWLAEADERLRTLRGHVDELERATPAVEALRQEVQRVTGSIESIESRAAAVDELHERLDGMKTTTEQLDERSTGIRTRMDTAESRFADLSRQAAEAQRVTNMIGAVSAAVEGAERRMGTISASIVALEAHAQQLDEISDRVQSLGQEVEQRQGAIDKATEHLAKASEVRREAAEAARQLEEISRTIASQLDEAETRGSMLGDLAHDLESRAASLGDVDKRMTELEQLLGRSESARVSASQALEQIMGRQATVDAVHAQVKHVFEIAERTTADVRSIAVARQDIEETRTLLDDMRQRLEGATNAMNDFDERRKQIEQLEVRLARADALTRDVRSTVELISAQRAVVDQVMERSGTLVVQAKQAEALIEVLRAECSIASMIRGSIQKLRDQRETEVDLSGAGLE